MDPEVGCYHEVAACAEVGSRVNGDDLTPNPHPVTINLQGNVTLSHSAHHGSPNWHGKWHTALVLDNGHGIVAARPKLTVRRDDAMQHRVAIKRDPASGNNFRLVYVRNAELVLENIILEGGLLDDANDGGAIEAVNRATRLVLSSCLVTGK